MPWLYYRGLTADQIVQKSNKVRFRVSFGYENRSFQIISQLRFKLARYSLQGDFLGFEDLTDQLSICQEPREKISNLYRVGVTATLSCSYDLSQLISE